MLSYFNPFVKYFDKNILNIKDLCLKYLSLTRDENVLDELPDFKIVFTSINTEEDSQRNESKKVQMETLNSILESFENLGIDVANTTELRNALIKEYIGSDYLEIIKKAENEGTLAQAAGDKDFGGGHSFGGNDFDTPTLGGFGSGLNDEEESTDEEPTEELGAGDEDFEPAQDKEAPSGLRRELNTEA